MYSRSWYGSYYPAGLGYYGTYGYGYNVGGYAGYSNFGIGYYGNGIWSNGGCATCGGWGGYGYGGWNW